MKRVVYDVTQLVHWQGKLTGIPRVMKELAVRFNGDNSPVIFVSWVKEIEAYCAVDLTASLGNSVVYLKAGETPKGKAGQAAEAKQTVTRLGKGVLRRGARLSPKLAQKLETKLRAARLAQLEPLLPEPGDTIFIPWGEWWDENFIKKLQAAQAAGARLAPVIHDVGPMVQPQFSGHSTDSLSDYCRRIVPIADLVLAVSQNTKRDLGTWLKQNKLAVPKIEVFREGDDFTVTSSRPPADPTFEHSGLKGADFILCVGTIEIKKNHQLLYYTYKLAAQRGIKLPKLVIVGRPGWQTEGLIELIQKDPGVNKDILLLTSTDDEELAWLYDNCLFTIFPSFYEGWGIPIAESVARGVPCLCSNTSSMVEIAEGIVEHFSPASSDECLSAIERWLDPKALATARDRTKQYQPTSWDQTYQQVKSYLEQTV